MALKFNRKYREYQPGARDGPPTERICKPVKCHDDDDDGTINPSCDDEINGGIYYPEFIINCPDIDSGTYDPDVPGIGDDIDGLSYR